MARFTDEEVSATLQKQPAPGETLKRWAFGVKQPDFLLILLLLLIALLPGMIAVMLLTKNCLVGLTDRCFLVLRFSGRFNVEEVREYSRQQVPPVRTRTGALFTHIRIDSPDRPFVAKFHRMGMSNNREHSTAIAEALSAKKA